MSSAAVEAVERIVNRGGENESVLRAVVAALVERGGCAWARVTLAADTVAAEAGSRGEGAAESVPVTLDGRHVAELEAQRCDDRAHLTRIALLVSPYCRPAAR